MREAGGFELLFVGVNAVLTLSSLQRKSFYTALRLLFRKKSRRRSRKNNYRLRSVIFTSLDYQLFSANRSKPLFTKNKKLLASFWRFSFHRHLRRLLCKRRYFAFRLTAKRLLCGVAAPLPKKTTSALTREKLSLCSVFHGSLDYRFFSVKRSSLRSERGRSESLLERSGRLNASFLCFTFHKRQRRSFFMIIKFAVPALPKKVSSSQ